MKKTIITLVLAIITGALALAGTSEPDSMYVHFSDSYGADSIVVHAIAKVDSIVYYAPEIIEPTSGTFTDSRDSKTYKWVTIGDQDWMAENLAYLPDVHSNSEFIDFTGATTASDSIRYGVYGYDGTDKTAAKAEANYTTYGVLYNWYAAMAGSSSSAASPSGIQGACPTGWHLPSDAEWTALESALTSSNKGSELADNASLWNDGALKNATDDFGTSGFQVLPGGTRDGTNGTSIDQGYGGYWWSSTHFISTSAYGRILDSSSSAVIHSYSSKLYGFSVRCLRD